MLVPLPPGVEPTAVASASDNLSDGWRTVAPALEREPGAPVLVVGGAASGSIGLYAVAHALALGSESVTYVDADDLRRRTAETLGATTLAQAPKRLGPFPITVDASSDPDGLQLALRSTAPDGSCTSAAVYFGEQPSLPLLEMYTKGITFHTGRANAREAIPHVLALAASGALRPEAVTSRVVGWDDAADALLEKDWTKLVFAR
jgi:alcohol dehydrogenase